MNLKYVLLAGSFFVISTVHAAGYQLAEYSAVGLGRSFAGSGVVGDDYSALGYNPAGMSISSKSGWQLGASSIGIRSSVQGTANSGESGKTRPYIVRVLPHAFSQYKLSDKLTVGLGAYVPFGLATDYKNCWFGRNEALRSEVMAVNIGPGFSYKITDTISFGASLNLQYIEATLTNNKIPLGKATLQGDDFGVNYMLGVVYEPIKNTRLGISYRSKVQHKLKGDLKFTNTSAYNSDIYTKITTPEMVTLSGYHQATAKWGISATARWTRWSQFKELDIYSSKHTLTTSTTENWRNTWFYSLGADYKYTDNITLRFGGAYDMATVNSDYRTARIPDGRRIWLSLGASYAYNNWTFDAGYAHLFVKKVVAHNAGNGVGGIQNTNLRYRSNANIFSLQAQYHF